MLRRSLLNYTGNASLLACCGAVVCCATSCCVPQGTWRPVTSPRCGTNYISTQVVSVLSLCVRHAVGTLGACESTWAPLGGLLGEMGAGILGLALEAASASTLQTVPRLQVLDRTCWRRAAPSHLAEHSGVPITGTSGTHVAFGRAPYTPTRHMGCITNACIHTLSLGVALCLSPNPQPVGRFAAAPAQAPQSR